MTKHIGTVAAIATAVGMLSIATPAFAHGNGWGDWGNNSNNNSVSVSINNTGTVNNGTTANASTGYNSVSNGGTIRTGDAGAQSGTENDVNLTTVNIQTPGCGCTTGDNSISVSLNNHGAVNNGTSAGASTGFNSVSGSSHSWWWGGSSSTGSVTTGDATGISNTVNLVNSTLVRIHNGLNIPS